MNFKDRQDEVLRKLAEGFSKKEVARELNISAKTVEWHWARIVERFETRSEFKIALLAKQAGII